MNPDLAAKPEPLPNITLEQLAALPLDRIVVSACCEPLKAPKADKKPQVAGGRLWPVGGINAKLAAARALLPDGALAAFGVASGQLAYDRAERLESGGSTVVHSDTLGGLLGALGSVALAEVIALG